MKWYDWIREALKIFYNDSVGLGVDNAQEAIDELYNQAMGINASGLLYDNTSSGLSSTNVQGAIDEVNDKVKEGSVKVSSNDGSVGFLVNKLTGEYITVGELNDGAEEKIQLLLNATANVIPYNNSVSGMSASNVQSAIDELVQRLENYFAGGEVFGIWVAGWGSSGDVSTTHKFSIDNLSNVVVGSFVYVSNNPVTQCSNGVKGRGVIGGGAAAQTMPKPNYYIDIVNGSEWVYFGEKGFDGGVQNGASDGVNDRGLEIGGMTDYVYAITISSPSNATYFRELPTARNSFACDSNATGERVFLLGGQASTSAFSNITDDCHYLMINNSSVCVLFGNLSGVRSRFEAGGNKENDRTVVGGGGTTNNASSNTDVIEYFTFSNPSNATYFGDITASRSNLSAVDNGKRGRVVFGYGWNGAASSIVTVSDYVQVTIAGNATVLNGLDFGGIINRARISNFV